MLRVLTLNCWNLAGPWRERREELVLWLRQLDADVVCLQEIVDDDEGRNSARWLADRSGYGHVAYGGSRVGEGVRFGNAVLSRVPIASSATHVLPSAGPDGERPEPVDRVLLHARTADGLDVFCTHLTSLYPWGGLREEQVLAIDSLVREHADPSSALPPILCGDFNADADSTEIRFLCGLTSLGGRSTYWQDAWRVAGGTSAGITWSNDNPFAAAEHEPERRIDYVFVGWRRDDGRGRVVAASVVCDRPLTGTWPTDHFGVLADIAT